MKEIERIKKKINELDDKAKEIIDLATMLIEKSTIKHSIDPLDLIYSSEDYYWDPLPKNLQALQSEAISKYQRWYSICLQLMNLYMPLRLDEFTSLYLSTPDSDGILDYLRLEIELPSNNKQSIIGDFLRQFNIQKGIISSIPDIMEISELDLRKIISIEFIDDEIAQAEELFSTGYLQPAGIIAGIALEKFLLIRCEVFNIEIPQKPTIDPLAQVLYKANKIDNTILKKIQYLGSIRNKCAHAKIVEQNEISSLINGVREIKNII